MSRILVVVPTFDHGVTLRPAIQSVLGQTIQDISVVVIGDGAPPHVGEIMDRIVTQDARVDYIWRPKSARTGEQYRDEVIRESSAEFVLYLSDDDVWMPTHAEVLCHALENNDLAATLSVSVDEAGIRISRMNYSHPFDRHLVQRESRVSLSESGHRRDSYDRLPRGWEVTPIGEHTDHWMWKQWLSQDWVRSATVHQWTTLHFPSSLRNGVSTETRMGEQADWWNRFVDEGWPSARDSMLNEAWRREFDLRDRHLSACEFELTQTHARLEASAQREIISAAALALQVQEIDNLHADLRLESERRSQLEKTLTLVVGSRTWRSGQAIARWMRWNQPRSQFSVRRETTPNS